MKAPQRIGYAVTLCLILLSGLEVHAQNRAIGARSVIIDDGLVPAHTVTLGFPGPGAGPASNVNFSFPNFSSAAVPLGAADGQMLRWNNGTAQWEVSSLLLNTGTKLGLGTSPASNVSKFDILDNVTGTSTNLSLNSFTNVNPSAASNGRYYGLNVESQANGTSAMSGVQVGTIGIAGRATSARTGGNSVDQLLATLGSAENNGTATINNSWGVVGQIVNQSGGTMNSADAVHSQIFGGSPITNAIDFHATNSSGAVVNLTGLLIDQLTAGTSSNMAIKYTHPTNPFQVNGDGTVWLGGFPTFSTPSRLAVTENLVGAPQGTMVDITRNLNPTAAMNFGLNNASFSMNAAGTGDMSSANLSSVVGFASSNRLAPNTVGLMTAGYFVTTDAGSADLTTAMGVSSSISNVGTGTIGTGYDFASAWSTFGGHVLTGYSYYAGNASLGHINNLYGMFIEQLTGGSVLNTAFYYNHVTNPFVIAGDGRVGIGVNQAGLFGDILSVKNSTTGTGQTVGAWGQSYISPAGATSRTHFGMVYDANALDVGDMTLGAATGIVGEGFSYRTGANSIARVHGVAGEAINSGTATVGIANAHYGEVVNQGNGTITNGRAYSGTIFNFPGSTIVNGSIFYAQNPANTGTLTNMYGLFIEQMTAGTNNFALLYNHATQPFTVTGAGQVGIGTTTPNAGAALHVATTDAIIVPVGTTAQRPAAPAQGMIRYNTTTAHFEGYNGAAWNNLD